MKLCISGDKNIDREILFKLPVKDILNIRQVNSYLRNIVCDDIFLKTKLYKLSDTLMNYKKNYQTWTEYFLFQVSYIIKLKRHYFYEYKFGNPEIQYFLFIKYFQKSNFLTKASKYGELAIVQEAISLGYDVTKGNVKGKHALCEASKAGQFHIVKYLFENFTHDKWDIDLSLRHAASRGHTDIVKYLTKNGADVNAVNGAIIFWTAVNNHLDILKYLIEEENARIDPEDDILSWLCKDKDDRLFDVIIYLVEHGANISINNYLAFRTALEYGNIKIANYLSSLMRNE